MKKELSASEFKSRADKKYNLGNFKDAIKDYSSAIEINSKYIEAYNFRGLSKQELGDTEGAISDQLEALKINPNSATSYQNYGISLLLSNKLVEAEFALKKALGLNPNLIKSLGNLSIVLLRLGKLKESEKVIINAIILEPNSSSGYLNLGTILYKKGDLVKALNATNKSILLDPYKSKAFLNLGLILNELGYESKGEKATKKSIKLNPLNDIAYMNLGGFLQDKGRLISSEKALLKSLEINNKLARSYFSLSTLINLDKYSSIANKFTKLKVIDFANDEEKIDLLFAQSNYFHRNKKYDFSAKSLKLANQIKAKQKSFNINSYINKTIKLLEESKTINLGFKNVQSKDNILIFIVGMPRSGSSLTDSILSVNKNVNSLGETNSLAKSYLKCRENIFNNRKTSLKEHYYNEIKIDSNRCCIYTDKYLENYMYTGIILNEFPTAKIIYCYRDPLDNILSIYRSNFFRGIPYSTSIASITKVLINTNYIMNIYRKNCPQRIYSLNYDQLVSSPHMEIKSLIEWLNWDWDQRYLLPHLNERIVKTNSNVEVRFPINNKSIGKWRNYQDLLEPAINLLEASKSILN